MPMLLVSYLVTEDSFIALAQIKWTANGRAEQRVLKLFSYVLLNFVIRIFLC